MQGVPQGAPFMFMGFEVTHCAVDGAKNPAEPALLVGVSSAEG